MSGLHLVKAAGAAEEFSTTNRLLERSGLLARAPRLPRHRWPYVNAGDQLLERARMGDAQAWDAYIAVTEREEQVDKLIDKWVQALIVVFALPGLFLVSETDPQLMWWGFVLSLVAQPFWILAALRSRQWGNLTMAVLYTGIWLRAAINHF